MNQQKLDVAIKKFKQRLESSSYSEENEDRQKRIEYYQSFTAEKIKKMSEPDFLEYISKLEGNIFSCPSFPDPAVNPKEIKSATLADFLNWNSSSTQVMNYPHYGLNIFYTSGYPIKGMLSKALKPSSKILYGENFCQALKKYGYYYLNAVFASSGYVGILDPRHSGSVNIAFGDGHVAAFKVKSNVPKYVFTDTVNPYKSAPFSTYDNWRPER